MSDQISLGISTPTVVGQPVMKKPWRVDRLFGWGVILSFLGLLLCGVLTAVERAREAAARMSCNLGGIALAFHNYQDVYGCLPPAIVYSEDRRPMHSWRVLILPFIEQQKLYSEFRLDEPWDSEHNLRLLHRMPHSYQVPWTKCVKPEPYHTVYHVFVGPGTPFEQEKRLRVPEDFPDGSDNTLLFVEAGEPVPWTKPQEIAFDPKASIELKGLFRKGYRGCAVSSSYRFVNYKADPVIVRASITRNGGEPLDLRQLDAFGGE